VRQRGIGIGTDRFRNNVGVVGYPHACGYEQLAIYISQGHLTRTSHKDISQGALILVLAETLPSLSPVAEDFVKNSYVKYRIVFLREFRKWQQFRNDTLPFETGFCQCF